jgi:hypothetical protein
VGLSTAKCQPATSTPRRRRELTLQPVPPFHIGYCSVSRWSWWLPAELEPRRFSMVLSDVEPEWTSGGSKGLEACLDPALSQ